MKFAIIGLGKTGHSTCCHLLSLKQEVVAWDRCSKKRETIRTNGIDITGAMEGHFAPKVAETVEEAIDGADYICINTLAGGHRDVAGLLKGKLSKGQKILIFNSNWGLLEFSTILGKELEEKGITLLETGGMHLMTDMKEAGKCHLRKIKKKLSVSVMPKDKGEAILEELKDVFPQLFLVSSPIITSMDTSNPVLHGPITIFMASKIEAGVENLFYAEGATPFVVRYIEAIDKERLMVMEKMGVKGTSCFDIIQKAWGTEGANLHELIHKSYPTSKGPVSVEYRFITEDVPFGLVPVSKLGKIFGVPTPYMDTLVDMYTKYMDRDFSQIGPEFTKEAILSLV